MVSRVTYALVTCTSHVSTVSADCYEHAVCLAFSPHNIPFTQQHVPLKHLAYIVHVMTIHVNR